MNKLRNKFECRIEKDNWNDDDPNAKQIAFTHNGSQWMSMKIDHTIAIRLCRCLTEFLENNPCPIPTDPDQAHNITCAICGKPISFEKQEVYRTWSSYVCKKHIERA